MATRIIFRASSGEIFRGKLVSSRKMFSEGRRVEILLDGDPFPVEVSAQQVRPAKGEGMPTKSGAPTAKELRKQAQGLGIEGWDEMTKAELKEAISTAEAAESGSTKTKTKAKKRAPAKKKASKKSSKKKASAKKTSKKASDNGSADNPFRPGTTLYLVTEALKKGGKRSALIKQLDKKLEFNPRVQDEDEFDREEEIDRRLKVIGYILRNTHGWDYSLEGRGRDAYIQATPPS